MAEILRRTLPPTGRGLIDPLPAHLLDEFDFITREAAFQGIHRPESLAEVAEARRRLVFDELFRLQLALVLRKRAIERTETGVAHRIDGPLLTGFTDRLPFELTRAQRRVIDEILADLVKPVPMHRLLQGDVGAGKTLVAVAAMLAAVDGGHQAALMAPTEVLAEQHFAGIRRLLDGLTVSDESSLFRDRPLRVELLSNRITASERKRVLGQLMNGEVDIAIGTHALIQEGVSFSSLGVVVIDEQPSLRGGTEGGAPGTQRRRSHTRRAGDDGHTDPPHGGHDRLRRPRRVGARRDAAGPDTDHHPVGGRTGKAGPAGGTPGRGSRSRGHVGRGSKRTGRGSPGLCRLPVDRRIGQVGRGLGRSRFRSTLGG